MSVLQNVDIFLTSAKNNLVREFIYRSNFLTMAVVDFIWVITEVGFFSVIYANTPTMNGWTKEQSFFFLGVFTASDALFTIFFQRNFWTFPTLINKGNLDILLTKPANPILLGLTQNMSFTQIFNLFFGFWILNRYGPEAGFTGGAFNWAQLVFWILMGTVIQVAFRFFFVVWSFWLERGFSVSHFYYTFFQLGTKPEGFYPSPIRFLLKTLIPFGFIGSVPASFLLDRGKPSDFILLVAAATGYVLIDRFLWRRGLLRYQSASS